MWTTFTAKISALGQPSSENCDAQQIAPKTLLLTITNFRKSSKSQILNFQKKKTNQMSYFSDSTCTIEYVEKYKSGVDFQTKDKNAL
jgi:hypothetical protein